MKFTHIMALGMLASLSILATRPAQALSVVDTGLSTTKIVAGPEVPEPASLSILAVGGVALLFRRRR